MATTINRSTAKIVVRGLAMSLAGLIMLMSGLPRMSRAQVSGLSGSDSMSPTQIDIPGPPGSVGFGVSVTALPNGNIVVTDPYFAISNPTPIAEVGAVYLYNGATGALISMLTGSTAGDWVGSGGVTVLTNGHFVVLSSFWSNGSATNAGAATWGNAVTGIQGVVSAENSLVGSKRADYVGSGVTALSNGNYVVSSPTWGNGIMTEAGAVTWGNGETGISGVVSPANSLVGSRWSDLVGFGSNGVTALSNGNYLVSSPYWNKGPIADVGAVTWGNGMTGISGVISAANSLIGSHPGDSVGSVTALSNGNYVVNSTGWDNGAIADVGAVTWGNGTTGVTGVVSPVNSLVGSHASDQLGDWKGVTALTNGNYVVGSPAWDNGAIANAGAATWGNGATGITGVVSAANSLVGSTAFDRVGQSVTALSNGNYVVSSPWWSNGTKLNVGAVTWGNGTSGSQGVVSAANSLVGNSAGDVIGTSGVTALSNGNYVVSSPRWDDGAAVDVGAATWGNGTMGIRGVVSADNSLVGSTVGDGVGDVTALTNGNYVVSSLYWDNGAIADVGAVTWCNGATGATGVVSVDNSLIGRYGAILVGITLNSVTALTDGNYVVSSPFWDNGAATRAGAVTWGDGTSGTKGVISPDNSLVGNITDDSVGEGGVTALPNGNYVVTSRGWDNGAIIDAGAITFGLANGGGTVGPITAANSVLGTAPEFGTYLPFAYDSVNRQLVVGRPASNLVTLFRVTVIDVCLQDDTNPNTTAVFDRESGDYTFCVGAAQYRGTGRVTRRGNTYTLQHTASDRRVQITLDTAANRATATYQKLGAGGGIFSLTDRDTRNNTCPGAAQ